MAEFSLTDIEETRYKEFREYIKTELGTRHAKKARYEFIMEGNGIGTSVTIREVVSGEERDITDMSDW